MLSSYYPKIYHKNTAHRFSKDPNNLTGGQKIHVSMIFLHSNIPWSYKSDQRIGCDKKHGNIVRCSFTPWAECDLRVERALIYKFGSGNGHQKHFQERLGMGPHKTPLDNTCITSLFFINKPYSCHITKRRRISQIRGRRTKS